MSPTLEALWSVVFRATTGLGGTGIAVFESGRILGGDSMMTYVGDFRVENGQVLGEIHVKVYARPPGMTSTTGLDDFHLKLNGKADPQQMQLNGEVVENPSIKMTLTATRRAELP